MRIGLTQMDIAWEDKEKNCEICLELFEQAKSMAVDFLVFPEMTLTGFSMNAELIAQGEPEFTKDFFKKATAEFDMAAAFGYAVKEEGKFYNKLDIMDRGRELSDYAKIHPFSYGDEGKHYTGGDKLAVAKLTVRKKWQKMCSIQKKQEGWKINLLKMKPGTSAVPYAMTCAFRSFFRLCLMRRSSSLCRQIGRRRGGCTGTHFLGQEP